MALNDSLVFSATTGRLLTGAVGATKPTQTQINAYMNAGTALVGFTDIGHTAQDSGFVNDSTEATSETRGSYQNKQLKVVVTEQATEFVTAESLQVTDPDVLKMYYGGGTQTAGEFAVPQQGTPLEKSLLLIRSDGTKHVAEYFYKVAIERNGPIVYPTDGFASVPLKFTGLLVTGQPLKVHISADIPAPA